MTPIVAAVAAFSVYRTLKEISSAYWKTRAINHLMDMYRNGDDPPGKVCDGMEG